MDQYTKCKITVIGKRRDGGTRYWCLEHKADATAKYGKRARKCRYAHLPSISPEEVLHLHITNYQGGIALWGAVPPVYDTTRLPIDRGIHVHARRVVDGNKEIDSTARAVRVLGEEDGIPQEGLVVSELDAIYYMVTSIFGYAMKYIECTLCRYPHLDKDWFSVHAHRRHLCAGCGQYFRDADTAIGNPIIKIRETLGIKARSVAKRASKSIRIRQADYPGGIQIWGSNPAILWTGPQKEAEGIHAHALDKDEGERVIDDTFSSVTIDDIKLDPTTIRLLMAQNTLSHVVGRVIDIRCVECDQVHLDSGDLAFSPHEGHVCRSCGLEFRIKGRIRQTIGNPTVGILARLAETAPRELQNHKAYLVPETL